MKIIFIFLLANFIFYRKPLQKSSKFIFSFFIPIFKEEERFRKSAAFLSPARRASYFLSKRLFPAGRLDKDTEGLLVITSDGQLAHRIISPKHEVGKVYYARLDGELTDEDVAALEAGIHIRDADGEFDARPAQIDRDGGDAAYIRVTEGKYHQVKRMFAARGKQVVYLKRMAIGGLALDPDLQPGEWRELTEEEVRLLEQPGEEKLFQTEQLVCETGILYAAVKETE